VRTNRRSRLTASRRRLCFTTQLPSSFSFRDNAEITPSSISFNGKPQATVFGSMNLCFEYSLPTGDTECSMIHGYHVIDTLRRRKPNQRRQTKPNVVIRQPICRHHSDWLDDVPLI
jgi:hypothetical protein